MTRRLRRLADLVGELEPGADPAVLVATGEIEVDGFAVTNPEARVPAGAQVRRCLKTGSDAAYRATQRIRRRFSA